MHRHSCSPQRTRLLVQPLEYCLACASVDVDLQQIEEVCEFSELPGTNVHVKL